jgi:hypothetical protein
LRKSNDESSIKIDEIQKFFNIFKEFNHRSTYDNVYSTRVHRYVVFINYEFEIIDFMLEKKNIFRDSRIDRSFADASTLLECAVREIFYS